MAKNLIPQKRSMDKLLSFAQKSWALEDWDLAWKFGQSESEAEIDVLFTEKKATITFDEEYAARLWAEDRKKAWAQFTRDMVHEITHIVLYPITRGLDDWKEHRIPKSEQAIFDEQLNTRENEVIDFIITRVFKL